MCSTPKPKRSNSGKAFASSTSILAAMNNRQRQTFAERANKASERRALQLNIKQQQTHSATKHDQVKPNQIKTQQYHVKKTWLYWLLSASLNDVIQRLTGR